MKRSRHRKKRLKITLAVVGVIATPACLYLHWTFSDISLPFISDLELSELDVSSEQNGFRHIDRKKEAVWLPTGYPWEDCVAPGEAIGSHCTEHPFEWSLELGAKIVDRNAELLHDLVLALREPRIQPPIAKSTNPDDSYVPYLLRLSAVLNEKIWLLKRRERQSDAFDLAFQQIELGARLQSARTTSIENMVVTTFTGQGLLNITLLAMNSTEPIVETRRFLEELKRYDDNRRHLEEDFKVDYSLFVRMLETFQEDPIAFALDTGLDAQRASPTFLLPNETLALYAEVVREAITLTKSPWRGFEKTVQGSVSRSIHQIGPFQIPLPYRNTTGRLIYSVTPLNHRMTVSNSLIVDFYVRATRIVLALRSFWDDEGHLPSGLEDLVPQHLDAIPADPYSPEEMIRYDRKRRLLRSVGPDLNDDGGARQREGEPISVGFSILEGDLVLHFRFAGHQ